LEFERKLCPKEARGMDDFDVVAEVQAWRAREAAGAAHRERRANSINREHELKGESLKRLDTLRHLALRLSRQAGAKLTMDDLRSKTDSQLKIIIHSANAVLARH
jgi:hypothetical protein